MFDTAVNATLFALLLTGCSRPSAPPVETQPPTVAPEVPTTPPPTLGERSLSPLAARGLRIASNTRQELPDNVGNQLNCTSCHLEEATRPRAAPWTGVTDRYPRFRKRSGKVDDLQDRMTGCFERSMNGTAPPRDSEPMLALSAYASWLSEGVDGKALPDKGMPRITAPAPPDSARGQVVFQTKCVACHQADGQGVAAPDGTVLFPPLWGDGSYNIAAGMARLDTAAAFVKWNMPLGQGGTLTDQEAYDVAAWFTVQDRPDFPKKQLDWPNGGKPDDARY